MKRVLSLALILIMVTMLSNSYVQGETTKTKIIVLVNRTVVLNDDNPITVYSGTPTFIVTGKILDIILRVKSSCICQKCVYYKGHDDNNNRVSMNLCSGGSGYYYLGGYNSQHYYLDYLNITVRKTDPNCTSPRVEAWIQVDYTGDWVSPSGGTTSGSAPLSWQGVVFAALLLALISSMSKR